MLSPSLGQKALRLVEKLLGHPVRLSSHVALLLSLFHGVPRMFSHILGLSPCHIGLTGFLLRVRGRGGSLGSLFLRMSGRRARFAGFLLGVGCGCRSFASFFLAVSSGCSRLTGFFLSMSG